MTAEPALSIDVPHSPGGQHRVTLPGLIRRFAAVGVLSTVVHLGLFTLLHLAWPSQVANVVALVVATVVNTALNRRWTFRVSGGGSWRHQVQAFVVFLLTWGATSGGLALLDVLWPAAGTPTKLLALIAATGISTVARFLAMRTWIFRSPGPPTEGR
jgi:putative flippase GtrA